MASPIVFSGHSTASRYKSKILTGRSRNLCKIARRFRDSEREVTSVRALATMINRVVGAAATSEAAI